MWFGLTRVEGDWEEEHVLCATDAGCLHCINNAQLRIMSMLTKYKQILI